MSQIEVCKEIQQQESEAQQKILHSVRDGIEAIRQLESSDALRFIDVVSRCLAEVFRRGNKVLVAGNGGSLCDAMHFAEEFTGLFRRRRPALPVLALSEPGHLTCVGNDYGFEEVFARGIEAFGKQGDLFVGLTTSGNSPNIIRAFETSRFCGLETVAFLGKEGGQLRGVADYELLISGFATSDRIQEAHMTAMHIIIERVEDLLFPCA